MQILTIEQFVVQVFGLIRVIDWQESLNYVKN